MHPLPVPSFFCFLSPLCCHSFFLSFCTSVLRHLAVCSTAELVFCWCVLTTCISGSSFLSTYSINFVISTAQAASNSIKPILPVFWGHRSDLHLLLGDAVHKWLVVSLFSDLVLQFSLVPVNNSKTVSKYWYC